MDTIYRDMTARAVLLDGYSVDRDMVLDDVSMYDYGINGLRILVRVPCSLYLRITAFWLRTHNDNLPSLEDMSEHTVMID